LFYITYNAIAYSVALAGAPLFVAYLALAVLSLLAIALLLRSVDAPDIAARLRGRVHERLAGGFLAVFGLLFLLRAGGQVAGLAASAGQVPLSGAELGVLIADLLATPVWIYCGVQLWRRRDLGYVTGAGLLFQASMLFAGLLVFFLLQPVLASAPIPLVDFMVILVMGLVCSIPFGLFLRGVLVQGR
jgi:hypothetical protein